MLKTGSEHDVVSAKQIKQETSKMTLKISKKLKQLEKLLFSDAVSEDTMLLSELDGFIAGIAVCPALIMRIW